MPDLDAVGLVRVLNSHGVRFVVIGGFAAELHNLPITPTIDIDITPARDHKNLERLANAFEDLDAGLATADEGGSWFPRLPVENWAQYEVLHLTTRYGLMDVVFTPAGAEHGYVDLAELSVRLEIGNQPVMAITIDAWRALKEATGRPKDLRHLEQFENKPPPDELT